MFNGELYFFFQREIYGTRDKDEVIEFNYFWKCFKLI
jgi:hypothetical protein